MIAVHVSAVLLARDGFTGQILEGSGLRCTLDGMPVRPVAKPGGYLVLSNLPEGPHWLCLQASGYREELVEFSAANGQVMMLYPALKPAEGYFFQHPPVRLTLSLSPGKEAGEFLWLIPPSSLECKLAQTKAEAGGKELRLFLKGGLARLPIPGPFLMEDGKKSELVVLESFQGETAFLAAPLENTHSRSRRLYPAVRYRVQEDGVSAVFPQPGTAMAFRPEWKDVKTVELKEGGNQVSLTWK